MKKQLLNVLFLLLPVLLFSQRTVTGTVTDANGETLIGATVKVKGYSIGALTDFDGKYSLAQVPNEARTLIVSYLGYQNTEVDINGGSVVDITMAAGDLALSEVLVTGSRAAGRTKMESAVPVDVLDIKGLAATSPQMTVNSLLNYVAPSFTSNTQTISDGTDHIDPASLRGLGPDQVLVLINGKRRHTSSLVNVNGTFGRGNVGTDLNAIPVNAISRIEILRDGAAAQYGSDAIAGVINIILKQDEGLSFNVGTGGYFTAPPSAADESKRIDGINDGNSAQFGVNYGSKIGNKGGFIHFAANYDDRGYTNRMQEFTGQIFADYNNPAAYPNPTGANVTDAELAVRGLTRADFNMRVGQSAVQNAGVMFNSELPIGDNATFYTFGGLTTRHGESAGFYRLPFQSRNVIEVYPNGFLPEIHSNIGDKSFGAGLRTRVGDWDVDFSNTYGANAFQFQIENTLNASQLTATKTSFNAGAQSFAQNTTNVDVRRYFADVLEGFNFAFGAEHRFENFQITPGEEASYADYGLATELTTENGDVVLVPDLNGQISTLFGPDGGARPGGAQVFPGFRPVNAVDRNRTAVAGYIDAEFDLTKEFLVGAAVRAENYSDFGETINGKLSARYKITPDFSLRGAVSTGFRAPSLHQLYYNSTSTIFVDGEPFEVGTFSNDSRAAKLLGIPTLKQETSQNYSVGVTARVPSANLSFTVDAYNVDIDNRVVYTGQFSGNPTGTASEMEIDRLLKQANATRAAFFANAIDSRTQGLDIVVTHNYRMANGGLNTTLSATFAKTRLRGDVKTSELLRGKESTYFDQTSRIYLENAVPNQKVNLTFDYNINKFNVMLRNVYFGPVQEATNNVDLAQTYEPKIVTDLSLGYNFTDKIKLNVGTNNLFDVYPDMALPGSQSDGRFLWSRRAQQFGVNGRYLFARVSVTL